MSTKHNLSFRSETADSGDKEASRNRRGRSADRREAVRGRVRVRRQPPARPHHVVQGQAPAEKDNGEYTELLITFLQFTSITEVPTYFRYGR